MNKHILSRLTKLSTPNNSLGRIFSEKDNGWNAFEEDRMRIINSKSFRRLEAKAQVFAHNKGNHFRKRLTHSLEVAAVARKMALRFGLNIPLTETIALAHDIGHPPFAHMGEDCLNGIMKKYDLGFYHNIHGFKIITKLERCFIDLEGLNLTWESLEGILKHNGPLLPNDNLAMVDYALAYNGGNAPKFDLLLDKCSSLEAQVAAISDDIAYIAHDVEDAFRAGVLTFATITGLPVFARVFPVVEQGKTVDHDIQILEAKRRVIALLMQDVFDNTIHNIQKYNICDLGQVRSAPINVVSFSEGIDKDIDTLKSYMMSCVYNFQSNSLTHDWVNKVIMLIFEHFLDNPDKMPHTWQVRYLASQDKKHQVITVCDFVAGMTDSFILELARELKLEVSFQ